MAVKRGEDLPSKEIPPDVPKILIFQLRNDDVIMTRDTLTTILFQNEFEFNN